MMSPVKLDLTPQLVARLVRVEKLVGKKSADALICEALCFYEDILKRALEGKKLRLSFFAGAPPDGTMAGPSEPKPVPSPLETRMRLAAKVGLVPKQ